jgi:hypothetical protein
MMPPRAWERELLGERRDARRPRARPIDSALLEPRRVEPSPRHAHRLQMRCPTARAPPRARSRAVEGAALTISGATHAVRLEGARGDRTDYRPRRGTSVPNPGGRTLAPASVPAVEHLGRPAQLMEPGVLERVERTRRQGLFECREARRRAVRRKRWGVTAVPTSSTIDQPRRNAPSLVEERYGARHVPCARRAPAVPSWSTPAPTTPIPRPGGDRPTKRACDGMRARPHGGHGGVAPVHDDRVGLRFSAASSIRRVSPPGQ